MISYFIKVTICWGLFYAFYALFLSKETFFKVNRWYLLVTIVLGLVTPILPLDVATLFYQEPTTPMYIQPIVVGLQDLDTAITVHTTIQQNNYWLWLLGGIYILGVLVTASRFLHGMNKIVQLYRTGKVYSKSNYHLVLTSQAHLPFSFFNYLFWSEGSQIEEGDAGNIITHEIAHINQWHSLDVLFLEILSILLWFSPPIYWYKKSLRVVHEYLADAYVLKDVHTKQYGHLLIKQAQSGLQLSLANHFLSSQLKKRIQMMTKDESKREALMKYLPALPLVCLMLLVFTNPEVRSNVDATARISLNLTGTSSVPNISLKSLWWTMGDFDKDRVKTILREAYNSDSFSTIIINENTEKPQTTFYKGENLKEMHKACIFLAEKYPSHHKDVQALTIEIAKEFGYALRFHENGESIIFQSLDPVVKAEEATPDRWTIVNDKVLGYTNILEIIKEEEINYIEFLSTKKAKELYGKEEGKDGAVLIKTAYWEVIKDEDGFLLQKKANTLSFPTYKATNTNILEEALKNGYFTHEDFSKTYYKEYKTSDFFIINNIDFGHIKDIITFNKDLSKIAKLFKKLPPEEAIQLYGEKGKNGVTIIELVEGYTAVKDAWGIVKVISKKDNLSDLFSHHKQTFQIVDEMPHYAKETWPMLEFIYQNIKYPEQAKKAGIDGTPVIQFTIEKDGTMSDPFIAKSVEKSLDEEALRIVRLMKEQGDKWTPGWQNGEAVRVIQNLPIKFINFEDAVFSMEVQKSNPADLSAIQITAQKDKPIVPSNSVDSLPKDLSYFQQQGIPTYVNGLLYDKELPFQTADIATVEVLKGMKAQIKYGEKGKNGVIEIQLKEGVSVLMNGIPNVEEILFADDGVYWGTQQLFDGQHWDGQKQPGSYTLYTDTYRELRKEPITYTLKGISHQLKEVEITKVPKNKDPIQITVSDYNKELSIIKSRLNRFLGLARANSTIYFNNIKLSDGSEGPSFSIQLISPVSPYHLNAKQLENFLAKIPTHSSNDFKDIDLTKIGIFLNLPCKEKEGKVCKKRLTALEIEALKPSEIVFIQVNTDLETKFMYNLDLIISINQKI